VIITLFAYVAAVKAGRKAIPQLLLMLRSFALRATAG
jgi:hypothetical protein